MTISAVTQQLNYVPYQVHADGEILENTNNKKIRNYVIKHPSLEFSRLNTIGVQGAFIQEVATDICDFVAVLFE